MSEVSESQASTSTTATDLASYQQFALDQQAKNNAWSAEQAQKQMDFQREMSNTAHQREVADLKAAGLNPILSANSGASVPNGAAAEADKSAAGNVGAILQQVLQAQSAREVAGMYNAATIAAATIAANASMYGADMSYQNTEDHPNTIEAVVARALLSGGSGSGSGSGSGNGSGSGSGNGSNGFNIPNPFDVVKDFINGVGGNSSNPVNTSLGSKTGSKSKYPATPYNVTKAEGQLQFYKWLQKTYKLSDFNLSKFKNTKNFDILYGLWKINPNLIKYNTIKKYLR